MNEYELSKNEQLEEYKVTDLNVNPKFPFEDSSFDVVTCVVSVSQAVRKRTARRGSNYFFMCWLGQVVDGALDESADYIKSINGRLLFSRRQSLL